MGPIRLLTASLLVAAVAGAQGTTAAVEDAAKRLNEQAAKLAPGLRIEFRLDGARTLALKYPRLSRILLDPALEEIRSGKVANVSYGAVQALSAASPEDALDSLPWLPKGAREMVIDDLLGQRRTADAVRAFRGALAEGELPMQPASQVLKLLAPDDPLQAKSLFQQILTVFPATPDPYDAWQMISCAEAIAKVDPKLAVVAYERILAAAAKPGYGAGKTAIAARFDGFETTTARDTLLVAAGSRLRALDTTRAEVYKNALMGWDLTYPAVAKSVHFLSAAGGRPAAPPEVTAISRRMSELRGNLTDPERGKLAIEVAGQIAGLPAGGNKLNLATGLANLSTEGDLGKQALTAVSATLAGALHENPGQAFDYIELASLVRYEHVPPPALEDPAEKAGEAVLALRDQVHQTAGFTLTALDGKTYSLAALRGKVVLLNFWATWCPPCRKEMPDMEKLSRTYSDKGLVVLAVSDEPRETVAPFIEKQRYTFPVLLDPDRRVHGAFDVEGIPKSFIFDREGRLAAEAIDARTERQFLELLNQAGLEGK